MPRITLDAGHGGSDPGAVTRDELGRETKESSLVLAYALDLGDELVARGHQVHQTRNEDRYVPLRDRVKLANEVKADCFISLHANASANKQVDGAWVIHAGTPSGSELAHFLFKHLKTVQGVVDTDPEDEVFEDETPWTGNRQLYVLQHTVMPAALVELGFVTNAADLAQLLNEGWRKKIVKALADAVDDWSGEPHKPRVIQLLDELADLRNRMTVIMEQIKDEVS